MNQTLLRGAAWTFAIGGVFWVTGWNPVIAPTMAVITLGTFLENLREEREEAQEALAEAHRYPQAHRQTPRQAPEPTTLAVDVFAESVALSVHQGPDGPTVSVVRHPSGEITTRVFPSWASAGRYATKTGADYAAKGCKVSYTAEAV